MKESASNPVPEEVPVTVKDRLGGLAMALVLLGLCAAMMLWPDLGLVPQDADPSGRGGRRVMFLLRIVEWIWSRPVGGVLGVMGLLVLWGSLTNKTQPKL